MPYLERANPRTECPTTGAHHPHRMICGDPDDDCYDEWRPGKWEQYNLLQCCVCAEEWPCPTKQRNRLLRRLRARLGRA
jgi:hypothetical protein